MAAKPEAAKSEAAKPDPVAASEARSQPSQRQPSPIKRRAPETPQSEMDLLNKIASKVGHSCEKATFLEARQSASFLGRDCLRWLDQ